MIVLAAIGVCALVMAGLLQNNRDLPLGSPIPLFLLAAWMFAGWYVLLDRPTNPKKIAIGAVMVGVLVALGVVNLVTKSMAL